jgi:hypothetical protein
MKFGASMFFTDYSMAPAELAIALEQRGFDIVWAPEHSHIPSSRKTPFVLGGDLPKRYYDVMDPFVTLAIAAAATKTLKVGTGVCLIAHSAIRSRPQSWWHRSTSRPAGASCSASATAGTRTRWRTTAPISKRATSSHVSASRR